MNARKLNRIKKNYGFRLEKDSETIIVLRDLYADLS